MRILLESNTAESLAILLDLECSLWDFLDEVDSGLTLLGDGLDLELGAGLDSVLDLAT
jgi:hypothetical protein